MSRRKVFSRTDKRLGRGSYVRVYERKPGGPLQLQIGKSRKSLAEFAGRPLYAAHDLDTVNEIVDEIVKAGVEDRSSAPMTLGRLFEAIEEEKKALYDPRARIRAQKGWSPMHLQCRRKHHRFWVEHLGADTSIRKIAEKPRQVTKFVGIEYHAPHGRHSSSTRRAYAKALVEAIGWATKRGELPKSLRWEDFPLPEEKVRDARFIYSDQEAVAICREAEQLDLRVGLLGWILYTGGKRVTATLAVRVSGVEEITGRRCLRYWDSKPGSEALCVVPRRAWPILDDLLATPAVQASGLLFPSSDILSARPDRKPMERKDATKVWRVAEKLAGVPYMEGRGFHSLKKRFGTTNLGLGMDRAVAAQSNTSDGTLRGWYDKSQGEDVTERGELMDVVDERIDRIEATLKVVA